MKFIVQGDIHLRTSTPVNRIDNYVEAQINQFSQLLDFGREYEADILCPGDLFDAPTVGFRIYNPIQELLMDFENTFITCTGNHDLFFHNNASIKDTALWGLHTPQAIDVLSGMMANEEIAIHGSGWEQELPEPFPGKFNILLSHISVFKKIPHYWKGDGYTPKTLREKCPGFDLYVCGDIHEPLVAGNVIVSGSMMRQSIDQIDYKPRCYLVDTAGSVPIPLYYKEERDVFNVPENKVIENIELDSLVRALKESHTNKASYKRDCLSLAGEDEPVKEIFNEVFDELNN